MLVEVQSVKVCILQRERVPSHSGKRALCGIHVAIRAYKDPFLTNGDVTDDLQGRFEGTLRDTYPVLVSETHSDRFEPAYVQINVTAEPKFLRIWLYLREESALSLPKALGSPEEDCLNILDKTVFGNEEGSLHDVSFTTEDIKGIRFYMVVRESLFSADEPAGFLLDDDPQEPVRFEYEVDDNGQRIVLGKGTFGTVYSGRELSREVKIAIKALNNISSCEFQSFGEEIRLHSRLNHRNIVRYLGSDVRDGVFVILMELVPGGAFFCSDLE
ncbi:unnamed protein product [Echinostoma caproni]|uniref:Protein kinase domain-containing protein n=1 Tax=Echinostoma caproni TaxID=27848 RepID=A0A183B743_9TREM|nr:unnamed protein product [Echinostoma caproni]